MESDNISTNSNESCDKNKLISLKIKKHETILKNYHLVIFYWKILHIILFLFNIPLILHLSFLGQNEINVKCSFYILICASVIVLNMFGNFYSLIKLFQNKPIEATNETSNFCLLISFCLIFLALILNKKLLGKGVYFFLNNKTNYQKIYESLLMIVFAILIVTFKMKEIYNDCNDNIPKQFTFIPEQEKNQIINIENEEDEKDEKEENEENEEDDEEDKEIEDDKKEKLIEKEIKK